MSFFEELKRRNVFRVGIAYVLLGWALLQGADFILDLAGAPDWVIRSLVVLVAIGLPIALFFAWAFELTPEGIKRESDIDRSESPVPHTARKLDRAIIAFLVLIIAVMGLERFWPANSGPEGTAASQMVEESAQRPEPPDTGASTKSIAVLPFLNMSSDSDNEYFSDGISEEILNVLADIPDLKVASRTSAFRFKASERGIDEIAAELGVSHVLEGSVRKAGSQVRITAQLIQAEDGFHLWSEAYDRELNNIFAIQDEIAGNIADVLEVQLLGKGQSYVTAQGLSPEDYEKFLKARFLLRQRNDAAVDEAIILTREVLENAPDFPVGLTQLAEALVQANRDESTVVADEIRALTNQALALEPDLAAAHMLRGQLAWDERRTLDAFRHYERAIELNPNEPRPHHWLGILLANSGFLEQAREALQNAVDLEPDHANANGYLGFVLLLQGDYDGAQRYFELQERLGNPFGGQRRVQVAALKGDWELAEQLIVKREGFTALDAERMQHFIAALRLTESVDDYLRFIDQHAVGSWGVWNEALELSVLGQYQRVLDFDLGGYPRFLWADRFVEARALPGFREKVGQANLPELWDAIGPPPACRKTTSGYDCANRGSP